MGNLTHDRLSHRALGHKHLSSGLSHKVSELQPLPNPHTWLRFDEENCTLSGINILSANDKSGNGNHHYALGVGSQQPTIKDNVIGKRQGAQFVSANKQYLFCNALHEPATAGAGIFVVVKGNSFSAARINAFLISQLRYQTGLYQLSTVKMIRIAGSINGINNSFIEIPSSNIPNSILYSNWGSYSRFWINSQQLLSGVTENSVMGSTWVGAYNSSGSAPLISSPNYFSEFELCEIFVVDYGRDLTEAEIRQQFRYLNSYYGKVY